MPAAVYVAALGRHNLVVVPRHAHGEHVVIGGDGFIPEGSAAEGW